MSGEPIPDPSPTLCIVHSLDQRGAGGREKRETLSFSPPPTVTQRPFRNGPYPFLTSCLMVAFLWAGPVSLAATSCSPISTRGLFCSGVTWNASLQLSMAALDAAAKADFDLALDRLHRLGSAASLPQCLESWKALQCASKFQKCSGEIPAQKVRAAA